MGIKVPINQDSGRFSYLLKANQPERGIAEIQTQVWLAPVPKLSEVWGDQAGPPGTIRPRQGAQCPFPGKGLQLLNQ